MSYFAVARYPGDPLHTRSSLRPGGVVLRIAACACVLDLKLCIGIGLGRDCTDYRHREDYQSPSIPKPHLECLEIQTVAMLGNGDDDD
jgi:hypothetical protein